MSLLDTASLILTPNGYKASKLYSVKPTDASGDMDVVRATTATRVNSAGLIESVAINVPRLDYPPLGGCPKILVEPLRTNLALRSEEFNQVTWSKADTTVTANATTAPDGTSTADNVVPFATATFHSVRQLISVTPSISHTFSVYVKANGYTKVSIADAATGGFAARFDLSAVSVISTIAGTTATITNVGSGWYRLTSTFTTTTSSTPSITGYPTGATLNNFGASFTGDGTSGVFLWGAQLEAGSTATSYIPTTTASVTRNADVISKTGVSSLIGQTEGTMFVEINITTFDIGAFFTISDGTSANSIQMYTYNDNKIYCARTASAIGVAFSSSVLTAGTYKVAFGYKSGSSYLYINGAQVGATSSATFTFGSMGKVNIGSGYGDTTFFNNRIKSATLFQTRLTPQQCISLTTP